MKKDAKYIPKGFFPSCSKWFPSYKSMTFLDEVAIERGKHTLCFSPFSPWTRQKIVFP